MKKNSWWKFSGAIAAVATLSVSLLGMAGAASADEPETPIDAPFIAPTCAGETLFDPTENLGFAVVDLTEVFGERLTSYNTGHIVPLYDAYGGSVLLTDEGEVTGDVSYPPVCGTRYVESQDTAVSEWMFCTDLLSQACGDTDAEGNLVDRDGNPINPMTSLETNPRLTLDQEKLIAYLIQNGHEYEGVGTQSFGEVRQARSDAGTFERIALQTLIWCISDPADGESDFAQTCDKNMDAEEQARLLAMIPDVPELSMSLDSADETIAIDEIAEFTLTTNVFNQPIRIASTGTAGASLTVCGGDATLDGSTLTVSGSDPQSAVDVVLCASATTAGTVNLAADAVPPSTTHIGWSQSVNQQLDQPCQVYATFHEEQKLAVVANAQVDFAAAPAPTPTPSPEPSTTPEPTATPEPTVAPEPTTTPTLAQQDGDLAATGGTLNLMPLWIGLGLLVVGGAATVFGVRRSRREQ